jgi:hypothetical protein
MLFYVLLVFHKLLESNGHCLLKMGSAIHDGFLVAVKP